MSGWIKLEKCLKDDPRVLRMASRLRNADVTLGDKARAVVLGALAQLWCYADTHVRQDDTLDIGSDEIDELVGVVGFSRLMPADWLQIIDENSVKLPNFHTHNGTESKKKAVNQKRQQRHRNSNAESVTQALRDALPDQDQTKTKTKTKKKKADAALTIVNPPTFDEEAWQRWLNYRTQIGKPLKPASLQAAVDEFGKFGADQAAVVQQSIAAGWQGLFALKTVNGTGVHPAPRKTRYDQLMEGLERAAQTAE